MQFQLRHAFEQVDNDLACHKPFAASVLSSKTPLLHPEDLYRTTQVMAILNLTPDSFSDGGNHDLAQLSDVEATVRKFVAFGASIIDIGGQSTRPKAILVSAEEELARILPTIKHIRSIPEMKSVLISVDTFYASVARQASLAGADIINDVSGGVFDEKMLKTVATLNKTIILMHMRGTPQTMTEMTDYPGGLLEDIGAELVQRVKSALGAGIPPWRIILDPGVGFAKTQAQNLQVLREFGKLREFPGLERFPWLVGTSRKGFVGKITGVKNAAERVWGTAAAVTASVAGGADIVRVHDVAQMSQVTKLADDIYRQRPPAKPHV